MYAARIFIKIEDSDEIDDLDTFADKAGKAHKGTWHATSFAIHEKIREHSWGFPRKSSAKAWVKDIREFASNISDIKVKSASIRKIAK